EINSNEVKISDSTDSNSDEIKISDSTDSNYDKLEISNATISNINKAEKNDKLVSFKNLYSAECEICLDQNEKYLVKNYRKISEKEFFTTPLVRYINETPKLTLSMIVKNEENRYLEEVLESAKKYIDNAVIIDDGSTDDTVKICERILEGIPLKLIKNSESKFKNEFKLRKQQWEETIATNPEWILFLDADEIFEDRFANSVKILMENQDFDGYGFRLYDFWDKNHYRDDKLWCAHNTYRLLLIRYQKNFAYKFPNSDLHCGRMPLNANDLLTCLSMLRLKHLGWSKEKDRIDKYNRYMTLDPLGAYGSLEQYQSILDEKVNLTKWEE
ncbi:MAG: glycosyltransferase family 2 protein, partial [Clostridioides sp.]|nr:glycosyltransferase family 2 protein [Clostridioides sp.]